MRHKKNQAKYFYMFIMPWFLGFFLLTFMPLVYSIYLSLTQYNGISMPKFIGLRNYIDLLFYDDLFRKSLFNSFHYAVLAVHSSRSSCFCSNKIFITRRGRIDKLCIINFSHRRSILADWFKMGNDFSCNRKFDILWTTNVDIFSRYKTNSCFILWSC